MKPTETQLLRESIEILTEEIKRLSSLLNELSNRTIQQKVLNTPQVEPNVFKCPECEGPMKKRIRRSDGKEFYGCAKFPECEGTRDLTGRITTYNPKPKSALEEYDEPPF